MGLEVDYINFIESAINEVFGARDLSLRMLELGNQRITPNQSIKETTGKEYFISKGFGHTSVDINGEDGALEKNLSIEEDFTEFVDYFDIITNAGTTEHVGPLEKQYPCFKILHQCLKVGGVAIHMVPDIEQKDLYGHWKTHCNFYYSDNFFSTFAEKCRYQIISNTVINGLRCVALKKTKQWDFFSDREEFINLIAYRNTHKDLWT
jgi:SAM-dependent methyltransferase